MIFRKNKTNFNYSTLYHSHFNVTYRNIPARRCPFDYVIYQMIITNLKPDLIIEIGTDCGGGTLYLADLLELNQKGIIHTIDIENKIYPDVFKNKRIRFFDKGWRNYDILLANEFNNILIIDDASHTYNDVSGVLNKFWNLVSINSYFIVEDGVIDELVKLGIIDSSKHTGGPVKAIREFLKQNDNFIIDNKWCNFFGENATFNFDGYLKRIK